MQGSRVKMLIDTDTASDDAVAILMALRNPQIHVEAITIVAGNVSTEQASRKPELDGLREGLKHWPMSLEVGGKNLVKAWRAGVPLVTGSDAGNFLVSGRKIPRDGGIILAVGKSRTDIEVMIREDPFHKLGLAEFRVIEFRASQVADDIQDRIDRF